MATITFKRGDAYAMKLAKCEARSEEIAKKAIYAGANVIANQIRANLVDNLRDPMYAGKQSGILFKYFNSDLTGDLLDSFGITPIEEDGQGCYNAKIGFDGYDARGIPNRLKARVMESGSSTIRKRPFVAPAVKQTKKRALDAMRQTIDEEISATMKG
ncbi:MAG: hypothetical protein RR053_06085 [Evtepia sp.]